MMQYIDYEKLRNQLNKYHFSFFAFFLLFFFFPSEFQSALCSVIQRMKLRIGCGSDVSYG